MSKRVAQEILDLLADGKARGSYQLQADLGYSNWRIFKGASVIIELSRLEERGLVWRWKVLSQPPRWVYTLPHSDIVNAKFDPLLMKRGLES